MGQAPFTVECKAPFREVWSNAPSRRYLDAGLKSSLALLGHCSVRARRWTHQAGVIRVPPSIRSMSPRLGEGPPSQLTVSVTVATGRITLAGDLNRRTVRHLLDAVRTLDVVHQVRWVFDVVGVTDYDDAGVRALGACYRRAVRRGAQMTVVGAGDRLHTALSRVRLDHHVIGGGRRAVEASLPDRAYPLVRVPA